MCAVTPSLRSYCRLLTVLTRTCASSGQPENSHTVNALRDLSVDVSKVRRLKGWVLCHSFSYVPEVAGLLRDMGADRSVVARVLQMHPEAVLCAPELLEAQREVWMSVCTSPRDLVGIIEKFPASFFTSGYHVEHQRTNVGFFLGLGLNKRIVAKLMASAPQSFSGPVEQNKEMVQTLQNAYLELGGDEVSMRAWLQKLLAQNPNVLLKPPEAMWNNLTFLRDRGFTECEILRLLSKLKGFVTEMQPEPMSLTLDYSQQTLGCTQETLRHVVLQCPSLLCCSVTVLEDRFTSLLGAGISLRQITDTPAVLELTPPIIQYRIHKLTSCGYDVRTGSVELFTGNKKDFERSFVKLRVRPERPLYNPVAPPHTED
ncbi:transcription termination factor 2, mitochondrial [Brachyhypopomus gauderio]|uniref:transcription termination factor 2, mitochondrial n=1 Tax=Brachyhypopomus gauderio TaxID=698409 RepID=UPI004042B3A2